MLFVSSISKERQLDLRGKTETLNKLVSCTMIGNRSDLVAQQIDFEVQDQ